MSSKSGLLFSDNDWTFPRIAAATDCIAEIAEKELQLDTYPNQLEVISAEQMLDAYASTGLPMYYPHWSFGKQRAIESGQYRRGEMGLAYELVINSNPCISYLMEENTMMMQTLVIAHAAFGHNAFFKNNAFFRQWTDAEGVLDYLEFSKSFIAQCEEHYGIEEVASVIDAAHAINRNGVDRAPRPQKLSHRDEQQRRQDRASFLEKHLSEIWRTLPNQATTQETAVDAGLFPPEPQENLIYFIEKNAPHLETWKREVLRIVRKIAQYLYPQGQTKIMNEGFACFVHYHVLHSLHSAGRISDGALFEFYASHTAVTMQPDFDSRRYRGLNPYAIGFAIFQDIKRICLQPTEEDHRWFPFAGDPDWLKHIHFAMREFRDESFVLQYLSPKVMRDLHLFSLVNDPDDDHFVVSAVHDDDSGYRVLRSVLASQIGEGSRSPDVQVLSVNRWGDRELHLKKMDKMPIDKVEAQKTLRYIRSLWGYDVHLDLGGTSLIARANGS